MSFWTFSNHRAKINCDAVRSSFISSTPRSQPSRTTPTPTGLMLSVWFRSRLLLEPDCEKEQNLTRSTTTRDLEFRWILAAARQLEVVTSYTWVEWTLHSGVEVRCSVLQRFSASHTTAGRKVTYCRTGQSALSVCEFHQILSWDVRSRWRFGLNVWLTTSLSHVCCLPNR